MDHSFTFKLRHACLYLVSVQQMVPLVTGGGHLIAAYYSFMYSKRIKGLVGLVG